MRKDTFRQAMANRVVEDPFDGHFFTKGKREARRRARHVLKRELYSDVVHG
jgi:hypothetical protein